MGEASPAESSIDEEKLRISLTGYGHETHIVAPLSPFTNIGSRSSASNCLLRLPETLFCNSFPAVLLLKMENLGGLEEYSEPVSNCGVDGQDVTSTSTSSGFLSFSSTFIVLWQILYQKGDVDNSIACKRYTRKLRQYLSDNAVDYKTSCCTTRRFEIQGIHDPLMLQSNQTPPDWKRREADQADAQNFEAMLEKLSAKYQDNHEQLH